LSTVEVEGFWVIESTTMFTMTKRTKPIPAVRKRNRNFFAILQGWTNARIKAVAARKANRMPGGLSSIPRNAAAIAKAQLIKKRKNVTILLRGVEKASIITTLFLVLGGRLLLRQPGY
jgi:hypothetical protein